MDQLVALIVEDEALIALDTEDLLSAEGFATVVAMSRVEAMEMASADLAVAVVNIRLAGEIAGQSVIRVLRERAPNLPIVVVTGFSGDSPEADLRGLGWPTIRLEKPAKRAVLAAAVWDVITQARDGIEADGGRGETERRGTRKR